MLNTIYDSLNFSFFSPKYEYNDNITKIHFVGFDYVIRLKVIVCIYIYITLLSETKNISFISHIRILTKTLAILFFETMKFIMLSKMLLAILSICLFHVGSGQQSYGNSTVSALFAFGDSILDTGNNNLLLTLTKVKFFPYGRNFIGGRPTGRFGNGRVFSDMIGIY